MRGVRRRIGNRARQGLQVCLLLAAVVGPGGGGLLALVSATLMAAAALPMALRAQEGRPTQEGDRKVTPANRRRPGTEARPARRRQADGQSAAEKEAAADKKAAVDARKAAAAQRAAAGARPVSPRVPGLGTQSMLGVGRRRELVRAPEPPVTQITFDPAVRGQVGYDTNVFRTDSASGDAFTRLGAAATFEYRGRLDRVTARVEGAHKFYRELDQADESEVYGDVTASRNLGRVVAGLALRSSYVDLQLLDREGNLLPRRTFASFSNGVIGFADVSLTRNLYLGGEVRYRVKNYEETEGLRSLDYGEPTLEAGFTQYLPGRVSLRLEGGWDKRDYDERLAAGADGSVLPSNPLLTLRGIGAQARVRKHWASRGLLEASLGLRHSEDLFQDELSYDQKSADVRASVPLGRWLMGLRGALTDRDFELRASGAEGPLQETFLLLRADIERDLWQGAALVGGYNLFKRTTNDPTGDYDIDTWQLGVVHVF